ncbi:MAG: lipocalin-like domain-containing protein, partial [Sedimentitalea sp.]
MNARSLAFCLMALPGLATAQGFAGLGTQVEGFTNPEPSYVFDFPTDHGPHPDFRIEWWYLTATLRGADGLDYGIQWTLFRSALAPETRPGWQDPQL